MGSIVRILDMNERIDQTCYFCGSKLSVKYAITEALDNNGYLIDQEVCCCNKCVLLHTWANEMPQ